MSWHVFFTADPLTCLSGCYCYYSVKDDANTVNCSHNNMTQIPDKLLPDTEQLIMAGNNIEKLVYISKDFQHLKLVDLQRNNISEIGLEAQNTLLSHTNNLVLSHNNLQKVSSVLQSNVHTQIWLSNNPFLCTCDMMWMSEWLQNASDVMDKANITCAGGRWNRKRS